MICDSLRCLIWFIREGNTHGSSMKEPCTGLLNTELGLSVWVLSRALFLTVWWQCAFPRAKPLLRLNNTLFRCDKNALLASITINVYSQTYLHFKILFYSQKITDELPLTLTRFLDKVKTKHILNSLLYLA